jgi:prepilin-type N-terminal cleavage/methylation domain-containing protein
MKDGGFTLLELIIVFSIILVISAFAIPGVLNYQEFQNEEQYVNQVINQLRNHQSLAVKKDEITKIETQKNLVKLCEGEICQNFEYSKDVFVTESQTFYFGRFGEVLKNITQEIDNNLVLETNSFRITINKYGGIFKEAK